MGPLFLQIFLLVNVFVIGALAAVGVRHARAHFARDKAPIRKAADVRMPPAVRDDLIHEAEARFRLVVNSNAKRLEGELDETTAAMTAEMKRISGDIVARQSAAQDEARVAIERTGADAIVAVEQKVTGGNDELKKVSDEALAQLDARLKALADERAAKLNAEIDAKLSDAVVSFLLESLGHDVDLGAQMKYVLARLDENKETLKKEILS